MAGNYKLNIVFATWVGKEERGCCAKEESGRATITLVRELPERVFKVGEF
jgi:hypothetical protein